MKTLTKLDQFLVDYVTTALWSSTDDDDDTPLDQGRDIDDIHPDSLAKMREDCEQFIQECGGLVTDKNYIGSKAYSPDEIAAHDFWLTRNGHGAGFWDGHWREPAATKLTAYCESVGSCDLYIGDDGLVHCI